MSLYDQEYPEDFERFWKLYPRKVGKRDALKAWGQTEKNRPPIEEVERAVIVLGNGEWYTRDISKIPHPATWLRRDGWLEAPPIPRRQASCPDPTGMRRPIYTAMEKARELGFDPAPLKDARDPNDLDRRFVELAGVPFYDTYFPHIMRR